jgi:hypothetical protein
MTTAYRARFSMLLLCTPVTDDAEIAIAIGIGIAYTTNYSAARCRSR